MAATKSKSKPLPESILDTDEAKLQAGHVSETHKKIGALNKDQVLNKKSFSELCEEHRKKRVLYNDFTGLIRSTTSEGDSVRTEFRMSGNTALDIKQETELDNLFGGSRTLLWQKKRLITAITDPKKLLADLGPDAFDYLDLRVKSGMDEVVIGKSDAVSHDAAFIPQTEFLANLMEIVRTLSQEAKTFMVTYLNEALKPSVIPGGKGAK